MLRKRWARFEGYLNDHPRADAALYFGKTALLIAGIVVPLYLWADRLTVAIWAAAMLMLGVVLAERRLQKDVERMRERALEWRDLTYHLKEDFERAAGAVEEAVTLGKQAATGWDNTVQTLAYVTGWIVAHKDEIGDRSGLAEMVERIAAHKKEMEGTDLTYIEQLQELMQAANDAEQRIAEAERKDPGRPRAQVLARLRAVEKRINAGEALYKACELEGTDARTYKTYKERGWL